MYDPFNLTIGAGLSSELMMFFIFCLVTIMAGKSTSSALRRFFFFSFPLLLLLSSMMMMMVEVSSSSWKSKLSSVGIRFHRNREFKRLSDVDNCAAQLWSCPVNPRRTTFLICNALHVRYHAIMILTRGGDGHGLTSCRCREMQLAWDRLKLSQKKDGMVKKVTQAVYKQGKCEGDDDGGCSLYCFSPF